MTAAVDDLLISRNPASGERLGQVVCTPPGAVAGVVARAREAQKSWGQTSWKHRRAFLLLWRQILARDAEAWADALRAEVGKPASEAMVTEVVPTLDALRWLIRHGGRTLADEPLSRGWQRMLLIPPARLAWRPLGVIGILATWNYPFYLAAPVIAHALAAGNAVVWKPSERVPLAGQKLQASLDEALGAAGAPAGLVAAVQGGPEVGRALVEAPIDKGHFTGGVEVGRGVLTALAARGLPAVAELSGFDPAIILPGAPLDATARALCWAAFTNAGQTCVAVKRAYVIGRAAEADRWAERLAAEARSLRVGDPAEGDIDVGPLISEDARIRFDAHVRAALSAGARVLGGGASLPGPGAFYPPTVLLADSDNLEPETALAGCFGPVLLVRGVPDAAAAIAAANSGPFGLAASVWGRDRRAARAVAARIEAGTVAVNDAVAPTAHAAGPFGGVKASGFGRVHGVLGLREFARPQTLYHRRAGGLRPQLFPYSDRIARLMRAYRRLFHPGTG